MGGRIVDLAVVESDPKTLYIATATGGLFKTSDDANTWSPVFDGQPTLSLGAVAVAPSDANVVWVGAGEANARNSVSWGDGVYLSRDAGKSWTHVGLAQSQHIGRIAVHPKDPEVAYVAALGGVWGANAERGLYKTIDGGKTWKHSLKIDNETGCIDVAIDPADPDTVYATAYRVRRDAFSGGNPAVQLGDKAGLYKSTDAGQTWTRLTDGLPKGKVGRCGIAVWRKDPKVLYAVVQAEKTPVTVAGGLPKENNDPELGGIFRSEDKGQTWKKINNLCPRPFYYGQIRIDPTDDNRIYVLGVAFYASADAGKTFTSSARGVHPDHHALWINPQDPNHLILGNDGGLYVSKDRAKTWQSIRNLALGQFYAIAVDNRKMYRVYGGLQDNGSWGGPSRTTRPEGILMDDWYRVAGADGFYVGIDPTDPDTVYAEGQYGRLQRANLKVKGKGNKSISPDAGKKNTGNRYNWSSPLVLSAHDPKTLYFAGQVVFKSTDRGDKWEKISPDLTRGAKAITAFAGHTISVLAESPRKQGLLYAGSDDGRLHITKDDGTNWEDLSEKITLDGKKLPAERWITRVECSHHDDATAYLALSRHRNNDRKTYLFKTTDYGQTWTSLAKNLPTHEPVHVIRESSKNPQLLFVGTELGLHYSQDGGNNWAKIKALPAVPVHDLVIHPRERELVIGTHGRSIYVMDVGPLEELKPEARAAKLHVCEVRQALLFEPSAAVTEAQTKRYIAKNPPYGVTLWYHLAEASEVTLTIHDAKGTEVSKRTFKGNTGLNSALWDLKGASVGEYTAKILAGPAVQSRKIKVVEP
jgi:photosystem II stability/assembly factor-like uncharacterized protein